MALPHEFSTDFTREAAFGTPAVAAAVWTANDLLIAVSIFYVVVQTLYLFWKWHREIRESMKAKRSAKASRTSTGG